jgi:hypothetical protein
MPYFVKASFMKSTNMKLSVIKPISLALLKLQSLFYVVLHNISPTKNNTKKTSLKTFTKNNKNKRVDDTFYVLKSSMLSQKILQN